MTSFQKPSDKIQRDSSSSKENCHFSNLQQEKEFKHIIETVLSYDPKVETYLTFMNFFREVTSENIIDELILLSKDELRIFHHQLECLSLALSDLEIAYI